MRVTIRRFERSDIPKKVEWINNPENNQFLHYDIPISVEGTEKWFEANRGRTDRFDAVVVADDVPVGTIGLLSIDKRNSKAEFYIAMGEAAYKGKGVAKKASELLLKYSFDELTLNRIYLFTETGNVAAQRLFERLGFTQEGLTKQDVARDGVFQDRYLYGLTKSEYVAAAQRHQFLARRSYETPIVLLGSIAGNEIWVKRDDLLPLSFGGNKARKAELFFKQIDEGGYDHVVTYGSGHSNHCRVVANCCSMRGLGCTIVSPKEAAVPTYNSALVAMCGADTVTVPVDDVRDTIERVLDDLRKQGKKPFFIPGGGHGNTGAQAYVDCYREILGFEREAGFSFDEIYFASGTGTTQAGLVCGSMMNGDDRRIVGISVARPSLRGRDVVVDSVREYLSSCGHDASESEIQGRVVFLDDYVGDGYSSATDGLRRLIAETYTHLGLPLDRTYTGKAFYGMRDQLMKSKGSGKRVLFLHTGGTPLFFGEMDANTMQGE